MTRDEFCKYHWEYYLVLEKDFLVTERYVAIDLGEDYLYENNNPENKGNGQCFSNEYVKQYQAICSEVDVLMKSICQEINSTSKADNMCGYTEEILDKWPNIVSQKVAVKDKELMPFKNWKTNPMYNAPDWWQPYNKVKHERIDNFRKANLKNVLNALCGLYVLEQYFVKFIGDRDTKEDVPNDISHIFEMVDWETKHTVIGKDSYFITKEEVDDMLTAVFGDK